MNIELVIFDLGPQLIHTGPRLDATIQAAFVWTELGDSEDLDAPTRGAFAHLRAMSEVRGTSAMFAALRSAGVRIAIATGCSRATAAGVLTRLGWTGLVDAVVSAEDSEECRPSAMLVRMAMARAGVRSPGHVAKVADTPTGLLEGYAAGCGTVIAVHPGDADDEHDLLLYPHTHRVATASLVPELLRRVTRGASRAAPPPTQLTAAREGRAERSAKTTTDAGS